MFTKAIIIPTGDELASGVVLDTDSPAVMGELLRLEPTAFVARTSPVLDREEAISDTIKGFAAEGYDLIILLGGSGGGHRYSSTLGKDFTHTSLDSILEDIHEGALYGKNGHMWSKLVVGRLGNALVFNLPGPYEEACAVIKAFVKTAMDGERELETLNKNMLEALKAKYGA